MNFAERIAEQAERERAESIARIKAQASGRAGANGRDRVEAAMRAELLWHTGASHEAIVTEVAGPYQRRAA